MSVRVDLPQRLYTAILATWVALVVGTIVLLGNRYGADRSSNSYTVPPVSTQIMQRELAESRALNRELVSVIREIDPEHPLLERFPFSAVEP